MSSRYVTRAHTRTPSDICSHARAHTHTAPPFSSYRNTGTPLNTRTHIRKYSMCALMAQRSIRVNSIQYAHTHVAHTHTLAQPRENRRALAIITTRAHNRLNLAHAAITATRVDAAVAVHEMHSLLARPLTKPTARPTRPASGPLRQVRIMLLREPGASSLRRRPHARHTGT